MSSKFELSGLALALTPGRWLHDDAANALLGLHLNIAGRLRLVSLG
jgi:hypothetical protein